MAVKVIKQKEWDETPRQATCEACGCTLEYVERDIKHRTTAWRQVYDGMHRAERYIVCAHCSHDVVLDPQFRFRASF